MKTLGIRAFEDNFNWLDECRKTAQWLWDAKFYIRDPWQLRVSVHDLLKDFDKRRESHQLAEMDESMEKLREAFEPFKGNL